MIPISTTSMTIQHPSLLLKIYPQTNPNLKSYRLVFWSKHEKIQVQSNTSVSRWRTTRWWHPHTIWLPCQPRACSQNRQDAHSSWSVCKNCRGEKQPSSIAIATRPVWQNYKDEHNSWSICNNGKGKGRLTMVAITANPTTTEMTQLTASTIRGSNERARQISLKVFLQSSLL